MARCVKTRNRTLFVWVAPCTITDDNNLPARARAIGNKPRRKITDDGRYKMFTVRIWPLFGHLIGKPYRNVPSKRPRDYRLGQRIFRSEIQNGPFEAAPFIWKKKKTKPENLTALGWPVARRTISDSQKSLTIGRFKPAFRACARTRTNNPKYDRPSFSFHGHRVLATTARGRWTVPYTTTNVPAFIN